jgi:hypothetical protein
MGRTPIINEFHGGDERGDRLVVRQLPCEARKLDNSDKVSQVGFGKSETFIDKM